VLAALKETGAVIELVLVAALPQRKPPVRRSTTRESERRTLLVPIPLDEVFSGLGSSWFPRSLMMISFISTGLGVAHR